MWRHDSESESESESENATQIPILTLTITWVSYVATLKEARGAICAV
jgi:hypothetical protein